MSAILLAAAATLLWSLNNILDKLLVQRFGADGGVLALLSVSALFPVMLIPASLVLSSFTLLLPVSSVALLLISGFCQIAWILPYMLALQRADVTVVMPLLALSPLFSWGLGILLLGEYPSSIALVACATILLGAVILTFEPRHGRFDLALVGQAIAAAFLVAALNALFKAALPNGEHFWEGLFWQSLGTVGTGLCALLLHRPTRRAYVSFVNDNATLGIGINALNEGITLVGNALFSQAVLLGQIVIVQSMEAFQPVFVFILGTLLGRFYPHHIKEDLSPLRLAQKLAGILAICLGSYALIRIGSFD